MTKTGRKFTHVTLKFKPKKPIKNTIKDANLHTDTADLFSVDSLTDKQLGRSARNPSFIADYNDLVSSTSPAGQDMNMWEFEMINRL